MREERVAALRARLIASGDLQQKSYPDEDLFDDALDEAVRAFQKRHGLEVDGVVGPATLTALNTPAEERARQIELNLERWRWVPQSLGDRYILVNIAHFELDLIANGEPVITMRGSFAAGVLKPKKSTLEALIGRRLALRTFPIACARILDLQTHLAR